MVIDQAFFGRTNFDPGVGEAVKENLGGGVLLTPSNPDRYLFKTNIVSSPTLFKTRDLINFDQVLIYLLMGLFLHYSLL